MFCHTTDQNVPVYKKKKKELKIGVNNWQLIKTIQGLKLNLKGGLHNSESFLTDFNETFRDYVKLKMRMSSVNILVYPYII